MLGSEIAFVRSADLQVSRCRPRAPGFFSSDPTTRCQRTRTVKRGGLLSTKVWARFPGLPGRLLLTGSDGNGGVGHGIEGHEKVGTVGKGADGRVPRIAQGRKARGLRVFRAAEVMLVRWLFETEGDVRIAQKAPRTFASGEALARYSTVSCSGCAASRFTAPEVLVVDHIERASEK